MQAETRESRGRVARASQQALHSLALTVRVVERRLRHFHVDFLTSIDTDTQVYVDAVCALLDDARGDWGGGAFYAGGYDVSYEPVVRGGKNFLQRAKVGFEVEISL